MCNYRQKKEQKFLPFSLICCHEFYWFNSIGLALAKTEAHDLPLYRHKHYIADKADKADKAEKADKGYSKDRTHRSGNNTKC